MSLSINNVSTLIKSKVFPKQFKIAFYMCLAAYYIRDFSATMY